MQSIAGLTLTTVLAAMLIAIGCEQRSASPSIVKPATATPIQTTAPAPTEPQASGPRVIFLGDSLTAGLGVAADEAYPAVVARALADEHLPIRLVNAGVSGDTTAGGVARLDWLLKQKPEIIVVALGSNDGMRGVKIEAIEANLRTILARCKAAGVRVLLLGMRIPPNYGEEYTAQFADVYPRLAKSENVPFVPFLLDGVGGDPSLNQADGIHPTAAGHKILAGTILPALRELVTALPAQR